MRDDHPQTSPLVQRLKCLCACLITACIGGVPLAGSAAGSEVSWERLTTGIQVTLWNPVNACPQVPAMLILQVDPERFRFSIYHFRDEGLHAPLSIHGWQQRTDAYVVFNAGLFREDYSYLGLLLKEGRSLGGKKHHSWQGLFAAEPTDNKLRKARVLDLAFEGFTEEAPSYREAAQSLMLLDRTGKLRVRDSGKRAYQTVVAEDSTGAILVMKTVDIVSLHDLAGCLHQHMPSIQQAMAMDGGSSSDVIASPDLLHAAQDMPAQAGWRPLLEGDMGVHIGLPTVIGISPRTGMRNLSSPSASSSSRSR
ncbi:MAG: phosphodiester glycosidase family protein [Nitrospira defluvii]|nr:phosphodiester glycosidase family protein [Nitrospira defluvii]